MKNIYNVALLHYITFLPVKFDWIPMNNVGVMAQTKVGQTDGRTDRQAETYRPPLHGDNEIGICTIAALEYNMCETPKLKSEIDQN